MVGDWGENPNCMARSAMATEGGGADGPTGAASHNCGVAASGP